MNKVISAIFFAYSFVPLYAGGLNTPRPLPGNPTPPQVEVSNRPTPMYLADKLAYLTAHVRSKLGQSPVTGTGFFFDFCVQLCKDGRLRRVPTLVTNKHVVLGYTSTTIRFTVMENGRPSDKFIDYTLTSEDANQWIPHPDNYVDLCALPIAPIIRKLEAEGTKVFTMPLTTSMVADEKYLESVTQLDDVVMIGYPDGLWDEVNNQPIFRKGVFATRPNKNYNGHREFVIDMPVYNGSSGSPVLIANDQIRFDRSTRSAVLPSGHVKLVGIVYKTFLHNQNGKIVPVQIPTVLQQQDAAAIIPVPTMQIPNNLGLVISASRMLELEDLISKTFPN